MILEALCSIGLVASWLPGCAPANTAVVGYVEGEYVQIAPIDVARIVSLSVRRGDWVKPGDPIGAVEATDAEIAVRNAEGAARPGQGGARQHSLRPAARGNRRHRGLAERGQGADR